jgi:hypothetical protein
LANTRVLQKVWFRIFITSRPEIPIRYGFSQLLDGEHQDFVLHNISQDVVDKDIYIFLKHYLKTLAQKRALGPDWLGEQAICHLIRKASSLFIWAATVCWFIEEGGRLAAKRLSYILQDDCSVTEPEDVLNKIYIKVLENSVSPNLKEREKEELYTSLRQILGSIVILFSPLPTVSLTELLHIPKVEVDQTLEDLHSILDILRDPSRPIRLHHPSFRDFLLDKERCQDPQFWVDEKKGHNDLFVGCLKLMSAHLRTDMCNLRLPGSLASEVEKNKVESCLPQDLQYACRYWVQHLQQAQIDLRSHGQFHGFF